MNRFVIPEAIPGGDFGRSLPRDQSPTPLNVLSKL